MKVGDFGLARDVYSHLYYRADKHSCIPVKWAAPEVLNDGLCTERSDVVSQIFCIVAFTWSLSTLLGVFNLFLFKVVFWSDVLGNI